MHMQRKQLKNLNESIDSVFLKENVYSLLGVPADFDRNNKDHMDLLKRNYRALSHALHPDRNKDNPDAGNLFHHVTSAYDFLNHGSTTRPNELFVGRSHESPPNVNPRIRLTRSDVDTILNTAHGGEHWKPKEGKLLYRDTGLNHVLSWEEEQKKHHEKINDALVSIYNPTSGERRNPGGRSSSTSSTRTQSPPPPKPTVMDRPPIRGNDTHSQFLHAALGMHETFLDPDHVGDTSPLSASDMHSGEFKTKNQNLAHLYRTMFSNGPKHGFVVRSPSHSEGRVHGYVVDGGNPVENFSNQTHHLSMILDPAYAQRAIASAHSSHRNFRQSFIQQHGRSATDQDLDAAIKAGTIRGVGLPAEEEEQKLVLRHIHALQMAAIHHPDVHANDLVSILQRKPSIHSDTESDSFGPRGPFTLAATQKPKLKEDQNLQELQAAAIAKLLHNHPMYRHSYHDQVVYPSGSRTRSTGVSSHFITSATQQAANLWDQFRKDINAKRHPFDRIQYPMEGLDVPVTPHHIDPFQMHPYHSYHPGRLEIRRHELDRDPERTPEEHARNNKFHEELERIKKVHNSEIEGHVLLGIHHPDAFVRQMAASYVDNHARLSSSYKAFLNRFYTTKK